MTEIDLTPITRLEYDIDAILNDHAVAEPITRIELILADIVAGNTTTVVPVTRIETFLAIISGADYLVPEPVTRIETFLAIIAGENYETPEAVTRLEGLLAEWVEKGSGIWKTVSGSLIHITDALASPMQKCEVTLEPIQDLHGQDAPYPAGGGVNKFDLASATGNDAYGFVTTKDETTGVVTLSGTYSGNSANASFAFFTTVPYIADASPVAVDMNASLQEHLLYQSTPIRWGNTTVGNIAIDLKDLVNGTSYTFTLKPMICANSVTPTAWSPYANICPITGWTGCEVDRTGVNVWDEKWEEGNILGDTGAAAPATGRIRCKNYIPVKSGESYYFKCGSGSKLAIFAYDTAKNYIGTYRSGSWVKNGNTQDVGNFSVTAPNNCAFFKIKCIASYGGTYLNDISINYPSSDTSYHAYSGTTLPVTFPDSAGTVYGGMVDLIDGNLTVDKGILVFNGSSDEEWVAWQGMYAVKGVVQHDSYVVTKPMISNSYSYIGIQTVPPYNISVGQFLANSLDVQASLWNTNLSFKYDDGSNLSGFKAYIAEHPIQVIYPLATPITYQLTPQQVSTLLGENNIWADTNGEVEITYKAQA